MISNAAGRVERELLDSEIEWNLPPILRLEDHLSADDVLALSPVALLAYVADCREELRAIRLVMHEALTLAARQQDALARHARTIEALIRERRTA